MLDAGPWVSPDPARVQRPARERRHGRLLKSRWLSSGVCLCLGVRFHAANKAGKPRSGGWTRDPACDLRGPFPPKGPPLVCHRVTERFLLPVPKSSSSWEPRVAPSRHPGVSHSLQRGPLWPLQPESSGGPRCVTQSVCRGCTPTPWRDLAASCCPSAAGRPGQASVTHRFPTAPR